MSLVQGQHPMGWASPLGLPLGPLRPRHSARGQWMPDDGSDLQGGYMGWDWHRARPLNLDFQPPGSGRNEFLYVAAQSVAWIRAARANQ